MTQREKLAKQGINIDNLVPVKVPTSDKCRQTGAFRERTKFAINKWSWNKTNI